MPSPAAQNARTGATSAGTMTFSTRPAPLTPFVPSAASMEPTTPPMSACDDDDGSPKYQVSRFQKIAPMSPANTISGVTRSACTMPVAMVAATASDRNAPTKLSVAAMPTATRGLIARVEIDVATAFAVSWKPFVKSNASAVPTTMMRTRSLCTREDGPGAGLRVLQDDALEGVGHHLRGVHRFLEPLEDVLPADHDHGVDRPLEQRRERHALQPVALVLQAVDLHHVVREVLERAQPRQRGGDLPARLVVDLRELDRLVHRRLDAVEAQEVRHLLREVEDVVEAGGQRE